jgi:hypothetical protein
MITTKIKEHLLERDETSHLDFKGLVAFLEASEFEFVDCRLFNVVGMATVHRIHLDIDKLNNFDNQFVFFIILHEYAHGIRMKKMGKAKIISMLSLEDFDELFEHVVNEELIADRYGRAIFHKFNGEEFPWYRTQMLDMETRRDAYEHVVRMLHGVVDNDEEKYKMLMESFIVDGLQE